jgi:hypothetical protein
MIERIPQRGQNDCAICAVAMVMGQPYGYDRVLADSLRYKKVSPNGKFFTWWEPYLREEGFHTECRPFSDLYNLPRFAGGVFGLLGMDIPSFQQAHVVAVDELGIIDPADNSPGHIAIDEYVLGHRLKGFVFHEEFLALWRVASSAED